MNRIKFIEELEKLEFKKDPTNNSYIRRGIRIFIGEYDINGVIFNPEGWTEDTPIKFVCMIKYLNSLNKRFCAYCGKEINQEAKFCRHCGKSTLHKKTYLHY